MNTSLINAMSQTLSPKLNAQILLQALMGRKRARQLHDYYLSNATTIKAGLDVIARRWPHVVSQSESEPVFILSAGWRSGSTFLQRIVVSSGEIFIWGEPYRHAGIFEALARQIQAFTDKWPWDEFFINAFPDDDLSQQWIANLYPEIQCFLDAHVAYFEQLFERPLAQIARSRWGVKEVTLSVDHARYLKWLFPKARFLFLIRNPYETYRSYRKWGTWYRKWPEEPAFTATAFGRVWRELAEDYVRNYADVDGMLIRYEQLQDEATIERLASYLNCNLDRPRSFARVDGAENLAGTRRPWMPKVERLLLKRQVEPTANELGYVG